MDFTEAGETASQASEASAADAKGSAIEARLHSEFELQMAEETRRSFEAGRERGRQEGRHAEREAQEAARAAAERQCRQQAADWIAGFAEERDRYLREVEHEVVSLSLAVAARILRREAQMDPLLLTGAVRWRSASSPAPRRFDCACPRPSWICGPRLSLSCRIGP